MNHDKQALQLASLLYQSIIEMCEESHLNRIVVVSILAKIIVLLCLDQETKEEMLTRMSHVYDFEKSMQPDPKEIH